MNILANIISFMHLLFIIFITVTPFATNNIIILLYYCFILFFVAVHWYTNDDTCVLTILECKLRGTKKSESFMGRLLKPIYKVTSYEIHIVALFLFVWALYKTKLWDPETQIIIKKFVYYNYHIMKKTVNGVIYTVSESDDNSEFSPSSNLEKMNSLIFAK